MGKTQHYHYKMANTLDHIIIHSFLKSKTDDQPKEKEDIIHPHTPRTLFQNIQRHEVKNQTIDQPTRPDTPFCKLLNKTHLREPLRLLYLDHPYMTQVDLT